MSIHEEMKDPSYRDVRRNSFELLESPKAVSLQYIGNGV